MAIIVDARSDDTIAVTFLGRKNFTVTVHMPSHIALQLADQLKDAAISMQRVPTAAQQAEQGARCGCGGADDMCPCQNVVPIR